ncbi:TIGR02677 family protein [Streptomyces sp. H10-C2]|uniref:TIGR02677 family protein n=1 Tax=unclassified Streptomyces TaxID=2593676 RepID=UPI0024BA3A69|nr:MULTISPECIES: TIGR02677 family protein [unclassified Streptomyces]MDJ0345969.1 TIGR02677 family protein [Streptomyces sp. PH10-H1]MDJ0373864.1 TIGR02677 family protein [Streptomyces sp. H10-C2]
MAEGPVGGDTGGIKESAAGGFGIDAFTVDDRMRLFHFAAAEKRHDYLWVLRALDRGRANYQVLLHVADTGALLAQLAAENSAASTVGELQPLLDALADWKLLDRSYDGTRAANLAEYRNRHYVYQFTQAGYRAYRAVEDVLGASLEDAQLSRLVFPDILDDLRALAAANTAGDAEEVYRKLSRLDSVLADMAQRAARFYLMLGDLARTNDTRPEVFLAHKDALLAHMQEFNGELARYAPLLAEAVEAVIATGVDRLVELAAEADERLFRSPAERLEDWRQRWSGLVHWFADGERSESERMQSATVSAIRGVVALLRRVTEAGRGGVSQESQLRYLAQWFTSCPSDADAHALFRAAFDLGSPRHISVPYEDPELIPGRLSWWDAPPVALARTLVESGREVRLHGPGRIERDDAQRQLLRAQQLKAQAQARTAAAALADDGVYGRSLDEPETQALLGLLDLALTARVPVSRGVGRDLAAGAHGVRLILHPAPGSTTVHTVRGRLHLDGLRLEVTAPRATVRGAA